MKKSFLLPFIILVPALFAFGEGVGIYNDDTEGYLAQSEIYTIGSVLEITDEESGNVVDVLVSENAELPPDRTLLLNNDAARALGIEETGFRDLNVSMVRESVVDTRYDSAWSSFLIGPFQSASEAYRTYTLLSENSIKATALKDDGIYLKVRYIPLLERQRIRRVLDSRHIAYQEEREINPYL